MKKVIRKKLLNVDEKYILNIKKLSCFAFVNIKSIKINNPKKILLHSTNIYVKRDYKLWSTEEKIDNINLFLKEKFNIKSKLSIYKINKSKVLTYYVIILPKTKSLQIDNFRWRSYLDFYKLKTNKEDDIIERKEDINIYFKILNFSLNNHLQYKLEPDIQCGKSYIKIEKIYKILRNHIEISK